MNEQAQQKQQVNENAMLSKYELWIQKETL
jgi:hypothetical protein